MEYAHLDPKNDTDAHDHRGTQYDQQCQPQSKFILFLSHLKPSSFRFGCLSTHKNNASQRECLKPVVGIPIRQGRVLPKNNGILNELY